MRARNVAATGLGLLIVGAGVGSADPRLDVSVRALGAVTEVSTVHAAIDEELKRSTRRERRSRERAPEPISAASSAIARRDPLAADAIIHFDDLVEGELDDNE